MVNVTFIFVANRMINAAAAGGIPGIAAGLAGMRNMLGSNGMNMSLFGNPSALGMRGNILLHLDMCK